MLVEDPMNTLITMCEIKGEIITWKLFKKTYETVIDRITDPVSRGTADTHFYLLRQFGLLSVYNNKKGQYIISNLGKKICELIETENWEEYKIKLYNILITNEEKSEIFNDFYHYLETNKVVNKTELYNEFKSITARTLIAWSKEVDVIRHDKDIDKIWFHKKNYKMDVNLNIFWKELQDAYKELVRTDLFMIKIMFVEISELRANVCYRLNLELDDFDYYLIRTLNSIYGNKIQLYGAPSSSYEGKRHFTYKNRKHVLLRLGDD